MHLQPIYGFLIFNHITEVFKHKHVLTLTSMSAYTCTPTRMSIFERLSQQCLVINRHVVYHIKNTIAPLNCEINSENISTHVISMTLTWAKSHHNVAN